MVNSEDKKRRDEFLLHWYDKLWESIDRKESGLWQFVVFYAAIAGFLLAAIQDKVPPEIAIALSILASFWGINVSINYGGWYYRNLLITINIEREFLDLKKDLGKIIPESYHKPKVKMFSGLGKIHTTAFTFVIVIVIATSWSLQRFILSLILVIIGIGLTLANYFKTKKGIKNFLEKTSPRINN
jgi:uncharacterized membrane protein